MSPNITNNNDIITDLRGCLGLSCHHCACADMCTLSCVLLTGITSNTNTICHTILYHHHIYCNVKHISINGIKIKIYIAIKAGAKEIRRGPLAPKLKSNILSF